MKKKLFSGTSRKIFLGIGCLILAIVFWFAVKLIQNDGLSIFSSVFG